MKESNELAPYEKHYSEKSFLEKIKKFGKQAGSTLLYYALCLFYLLQDKETPTRTKVLIAAALGYFILPTDIIPDLSPVIGFSDDLGALVFVYDQVKTHLKPEHIEKARQKSGIESE